MLISNLNFMNNNAVNELFPETLQILRDLISFRTISGENNLEFVNYHREKIFKS